jgi:D-amino peptidase
LHAAHFGVPLLHVSGDEALCAEAGRLFPWVATTPTKRGTGWATCELYPVADVRARIRRDVATAIARRSAAQLWSLPAPMEVSVEYAWSGLADDMARTPGVRRTHARAVAWHLPDARYVFNWPGPQWQPPEQG